jgi:PPOX class probable F420-dependent enzyme
MPSLTMTDAERDEFLAGVRVGILAVAASDGGALAVPVWYMHEPGAGVWFATGRESRKAKLLARAGRAGFCVQVETPPYRYVSLEGPVTIEPCDYERHQVPMAVRYLGERGAEAYLAASGGPAAAANAVVVRIRPERWRSEDYGKMRE